ncbi:MAG: hypothetical protein ACRDOT_08500 [Aeromicrobium sp.]
MQEPPASGPYPPDTIWRFPPPPVSRLWLVAAIVGGILGVFAAGGALTFLAVNTERDLPGFINDPRVVKVAVRECKLMTSTVKGQRFNGSPDERLDALRDQNTAVETMVARIRLISTKVRDSDRPLDAWLDDWETLVSDRERYIGQRRRGEDVEFRVSRSPDGDPINKRMDMAAEDVCDVPDVLLEPHLAGTRQA